MEPQIGVILGSIMGILALCAAAVKIKNPASIWHRRLGKIAVIPAVILLLGMTARFVRYQAHLSNYSRLHVIIGTLAFMAFIAKFLARRNILISPRRMKTLGYALTVLFPLAAFGMVVPYAKNAYFWKSLNASEVIERPDQTAFNKICLSCHNRETAMHGFGKRSVDNWIAIIEPMAWAGSCDREETRAALAAILATSSATVTNLNNNNSNTTNASASDAASSQLQSSSLSLASAKQDAIDMYCVGCHDRLRVTEEGARSSDAWERIIARMRQYTLSRNDVASISDKAALEVINALASAGLIASQR